MDGKKGPLTPEHHQALREFISRALKTKDYLTKCTNCGLDVEQEKAANDQQLFVANKILEEFFPNGA